MSQRDPADALREHDAIPRDDHYWNGQQAGLGHDLAACLRETLSELDHVRNLHRIAVQAAEANQRELRETLRSRDDWKIRHDALDRQGYDVARERDDMRAKLDAYKQQFDAEMDAYKQRLARAEAERSDYMLLAVQAEQKLREAGDQLRLAEAVVEAAAEIDGHSETCPISAPGGRELPHGSFCDCGRETLGDALAAYRAATKEKGP
jgi:hypothetical protein